MRANIPEIEGKRIVVVGGGFAGLKLATKLVKTDYQIVLLDMHNYHMFQPLLYQVATAGIEPSAISFPYRKVFQSRTNIHIRVTEVLKIEPEKSQVLTTIGEVSYDYLVIAIGTTSNYFGNEHIRLKSYPMKSISEALGLRNTILQNFEDLLISEDTDEISGMMNFVVVGAGPTGVETSGALAEMKRFVLPKDYPEIDFNKMNIYLLDAAPKVLNGMSEIASEKAKEYLEKLGVKVLLGAAVSDYDGKVAKLSNGSSIRTDTLIWAAGVKGNKLEGLSPESVGHGNLFIVNETNLIKGYSNIYAIGDIALMTTQDRPRGYPQVAQVAIQQASNLADNFKRLAKEKPIKDFVYKDLGSMATVGRNHAVVDLPFIRFQGFIGWMAWMMIHLKSILGVKNKVLIFINWFWNYITYDQSLRLIIKARNKPRKVS
jgi:NADH:ubiquinone reductase (H+-translocating)